MTLNNTLVRFNQTEYKRPVVQPHNVWGDLDFNDALLTKGKYISDFDFGLLFYYPPH